MLVGPISVSCSITSTGSAMNTGPQGGSLAILKARLSSGPISSALFGSALNLVTGSAMATRSCESKGLWKRMRVSCWPAVTISGEAAFNAPYIMPMALPSPGATCRLATAVRPVAWA